MKNLLSTAALGVFLTAGVANSRAADASVNVNINEDKSKNAVTTPVLGDSQLSYSELPAVVQSTVKAHGPASTIKQIKKENRTSGNVYVVEFEEKGLNTKMEIAANGTVIKDSRDNPINKAINRIEGKEAPATAHVDTKAKGADASVTVDTDKRGAHVDAKADVSTDRQAYKYSALPSAVQKAVKREANPSAIKEIHRETVNGKPVYEVEFSREGRNVVLQIADDGTIMKDNRNNAVDRALGVPAAGTRGEGSVKANVGDARVEGTARVPATDGTVKLSYDATPSEVQKAITSEAAAGTVSQIKRVVRKGKTVYEVDYTRRDGKSGHIQIADDGTILKTTK